MGLTGSGSAPPGQLLIPAGGTLESELLFPNISTLACVTYLKQYLCAGLVQPSVSARLELPFGL